MTGDEGRATASLLAVHGLLAGTSRVVASFLIVALAVLVTVAALGRYTGFVRVPGAHELSGYMLVALVYVGLAGALSEGRFIRVTLVYSRYGRNSRRAIDAANYVIALLVTLALLLSTWNLVAEAFTRSIRTVGELLVPLFPLYGVMAIGLSMLALQIGLSLALHLLGRLPLEGELDQPSEPLATLDE